MNEKLYPEFSILIVDDEISWLRSLGLSLERSGGITNLLKCSDSREVHEIIAANNVGVVLLDLTMPHISGEEILKELRAVHPDIAVIIISGMNQVKHAVDCMKLGALDYLVKTSGTERLITSVMNAVRICELERENRAMRESMIPGHLEHPEAFSHIITQNSFMFSVFGYIEAIAKTRQPVLITGESGTGKELIARSVHHLSRENKPLVSVNVAGLDDNIFSDTLFGHTRGAFTGADSKRKGMTGEAGDGTLFLDEIGDLSPASQVKLLRLLQENEYYAVGSDRPSINRARIVCSTHRNLTEKEKEGLFRKDLYYRLHTHHIHLPPLRERKDDIPLLLDHFLELAATETGREKPLYPRELPVLLSTYHFPGNIRELKSMVYDALTTHKSGTLSMEKFKTAIDKSNGAFAVSGDASFIKEGDNPFSPVPTLPSLSRASELLVLEAMERANGNQSIAARLIGISQPAISKRLKMLKKAPPDTAGNQS